MKASEFLALFPAIQRDFSTGGGCTAWNLDLPNGCYVLITDGVDACQPSMKARKACFSVNYDCTECGSEPRDMTWAVAAEWLRGVVDASRAAAYAESCKEARR